MGVRTNPLRDAAAIAGIGHIPSAAAIDRAQSSLVAPGRGSTVALRAA